MAPGRVDAAEQLRIEAEQFARNIATIVSAFTGDSYEFRATIVGDRASIELSDAAGGARDVALMGDGEHLLTLQARYHCIWNQEKGYLGVESSQMAVHPLADTDGEPLFRYDFDRKPTSAHIPCAHLQVHAHRDSFTHLLGWGGTQSKRARRRINRGLKRTPSVSEFHFPVGGPRFRPSLEDVLEILKEEFGLETGGDWEQVRDARRIEWRKTQVSAAVRDSPGEAARVLRELGYTVTGPDMPDNEDKLRMI